MLMSCSVTLFSFKITFCKILQNLNHPKTIFLKYYETPCMVETFRVVMIGSDCLFVTNFVDVFCWLGFTSASGVHEKVQVFMLLVNRVRQCLSIQQQYGKWIENDYHNKAIVSLMAQF